MESVTDVLIGRGREPAGLRRMVGVSAILHAATAVVVLLVPLGLGRPAEMPRTVMTISLGGAEGPRAGGANPMAARPVQAVAPVREPAARPEPARPPAARTPAMTLPAPGAKPPAEPQPVVRSAPDEATGRTPVFGEQERFGGAAAETGGVGFGGLTAGAGGGMGGGYLDVGDFCCPDYLVTMQRLIIRSWNAAQRIGGSTTMKYTILRSGQIAAVQVEQSSGYAALDLSAQRALLTTKLPPLPDAFDGSSLTVHLIFEYRR